MCGSLLAFAYSYFCHYHVKDMHILHILISAWCYSEIIYWLFFVVFVATFRGEYCRAIGIMAGNDIGIASRCSRDGLHRRNFIKFGAISSMCSKCSPYYVLFTPLPLSPHWNESLFICLLITSHPHRIFPIKHYWMDRNAWGKSRFHYSRISYTKIGVNLPMKSNCYSMTTQTN